MTLRQESSKENFLFDASRMKRFRGGDVMNINYNNNNNIILMIKGTNPTNEKVLLFIEIRLKVISSL